MPNLEGPSYIPKNGDIKSLVILLHGFGADGNDLIGLAPHLANDLPNTAFYAPDGPQVCEISPFGRQWFSLAACDGDYGRRQAGTQKAAFENMYGEASSASELINAFIREKCAEHNVDNSKVALVGFSQGSMMALHIGLRQSEPFSALVGFSGALVGGSQLKTEKTSTCPVLLIHGESDEMLPVHAVELAEKTLDLNGIDVTVVRRPHLGHSIDMPGLQQAAAFLKDNLD